MLRVVHTPCRRIFKISDIIMLGIYMYLYYTLYYTLYIIDILYIVLYTCIIHLYSQKRNSVNCTTKSHPLISYPTCTSAYKGGTKRHTREGKMFLLPDIGSLNYRYW